MTSSARTFALTRLSEEKQYDGNLIADLFSKVDKVQPPADDIVESDDEIELERRLRNVLTVDEVLENVKRRAS